MVQSGRPELPVAMARASALFPSPIALSFQCKRGIHSSFRASLKEAREQSSGYPRGRLLAGNRNTDGSFANQSTNANFWSSTESAANAWNRNLNSGQTGVNRNANNQAYGFSVRCLKDWNNLKLETWSIKHVSGFMFQAVFYTVFMADQSQSPATKNDVKGIMEYLARNDEGIHLVQKELAFLRKDMDKRFTETHHHFGVVAEDIKHDFQGAFKDRLEQHDDRILRLEQHMGLVAG